MPAFNIEPNSLYDDSMLVLALNIPSSSLIRARREGKLRHRRIGHRVVYLGSWLLDWIKSSPSPATMPEAVCDGK